MMYREFLALYCLLAPPIFAKADQQIILTLTDGSKVNLSVSKDTAFEYSMPYGIMKIPLADISDVKLGVHVDDPKPYADSVSALGSVEYKKRDAASKFLRDNRLGAYKYLLEAGSADLEVNKRIDVLLKAYKEFPEVYDSINSKHGSFNNGCLIEKKIEGKSQSLGSLSIKLSQIKRLQTVLLGERTLEFSKEWTFLGYSSGVPILIQSEGQVDLWPQQPGQYTCGPRGYSAVGPNGLPSGCLMIRVGGEPPVNAGEYYVISDRTGRVEVRINDSTWAGQTPTGQYKIKIGNNNLDK